MKPIQTLPADFYLAWSLELKHNTRLNIILQLIGLVWMALAGWLLSLCLLWMRPELADALQGNFTGSTMLIGLLILLVLMIAVIILHELVHGLFFLIFTGKRPEFGLGPGYAFAAMPDWFFPKGRYLVIGLSPLLGLTAMGLAACVFAPLPWLGVILAGMIINAGGAIGDMYICGRIAREGREVFIKDSGDGFQLYRRQSG